MFRLSFVLALAFIGTSAFAQHLTLGKALRSPETAKSIALDLTAGKTYNFFHQVAAFDSLESIRVTAWQAKSELNHFVEQVRVLPQLKRLELDADKLYDLPENITLLTGLEEIVLNADEDWLTWPTDGIRVDFVDDEKGRADLKVVLYREQPFEAMEVQLMVGLFPDALVDKIMVDESQDFTFKPRPQGLVRPPLPGLDVPNTNYTVNGEAGGTLYYGSGSTINIPANAFVNSRGEAVEGAIKLTYREVSDPVSMLASGIPMTYDSAGVQTNFESAGMLELRAYQNGEALTLREDALVDIQLATPDAKDRNYNLYYLDEERGDWVYQNSEANVIIREQAQPLSNAWAAFDRLNSHGLMTNTFDATLFQDRYDSDEYSFLYKKTEDHSRVIFNQQSVQILGRRLVDWTEEPRIELTPVNFSEAGKYFTLEASHKSFPELNAFHHVVWEVHDDFIAEFFWNQWVKGDETVHDLRITKGCSGSAFTIEFKGKKQRLEVDLIPHFSNQWQEANASDKAWVSRFNRYEKLLERKATLFNREVMHKRKRFGVAQAHAWFALSSQFMSDEERAMDRNNWLAYVDLMKANYGYLLSDPRVMDEDYFAELARENRRRARQLERAQSRRGIQVSFLGLINIDRSMRPFSFPEIEDQGQVVDQLVKFKGRFTDRKGEKLKVQSIYVFAEGFNGVLRYDKTQGSSWVEIGVNPKYNNTIVGIDQFGNVSVLRNRGVNQLELSSNKVLENTVAMRTLSGKFTSVDELRKQLKL